MSDTSQHHRVSPQMRLKRGLLALVDRGWFGMTPLKTHIVICGFPRAGSTLLQLMITSCVEGIKTFAKEHNALPCAMNAWRNQPYMLSKRPNDIFRVDEVRDYYADKAANVRFLLTLRDPRDVLVSQHSNRPGENYVDFSRWNDIYQCFQKLSGDDDVRVVRFEELVTNPNKVQDELTRFMDWTTIRPFSEYAEGDLSRQKTTALNGLRPPDSSAIARWRNPKHHARLKECLSEMPNLPQLLVDLDYEANDRWTADIETESVRR